MWLLMGEPIFLVSRDRPEGLRSSLSGRVHPLPLLGVK
jgi:hypothetical protein